MHLLSPHAFNDPLSFGQMGDKYLKHHLRNVRKTDADPASLCIIHCDFQSPKFSLTVVAVPLPLRG